MVNTNVWLYGFQPNLEIFMVHGDMFGDKFLVTFDQLQDGGVTEPNVSGNGDLT